MIRLLFSSSPIPGLGFIFGLVTSGQDSFFFLFLYCFSPFVSALASWFAVQRYGFSVDLMVGQWKFLWTEHRRVSGDESG